MISVLRPRGNGAGVSGPGGNPAYNADQYLSMLIEGITLGVPEVETQAYNRFRTNVEHLVQQLASKLPNEDKLALAQAIIREFDTYRGDAETAIHEQAAGWRGLVSKLFGKLLTSLGIEQHAPDAFSLNQRIRYLTTGTDIRAWSECLDDYLDPTGGSVVPNAAAARLRTADDSKANDNAAGLPGGGLALERLKDLIAHSSNGFVVLFRLGCLDLINERFGDEAVQDSVMAISAYLTQSLHRDDAIYHWTDASLLAIVLGRTNEHLLNADLKRIVSLNRDVHINIGSHIVMLRIPLDFEITPISQLRSVDDVRKLTLTPTITQ
jgi:hypothetical protein